MTATHTERPAGIPEAIAAALEESGDARLGAIVHYAHSLLRAQPPLPAGLDDGDDRFGRHCLGRIGAAGGG